VRATGSLGWIRGSLKAGIRLSLADELSDELSKYSRYPLAMKKIDKDRNISANPIKNQNINPPGTATSYIKRLVFKIILS